MSLFGDRRRRLGFAFVLVSIISLYILWKIVWTVFFALTLVYVLYPWRRQLVDHGLHPRLAAAVLTTVAFFGVVGLFMPVLLVIYQRRAPILDFFRDAPEVVELSFAGFTFTYELVSLVPVIRNTLSTVAVEVASAAPILAMKVFLFVFLVYALLYKPNGVRSLLFRTVPGDVQEELVAYHERIRDTLYGLYFVQAATGVLTFLIALPVFAMLGYGAYFSIAVLSGILQFVPILGPSVVVVAIAAVEVAGGDVPQAILVVVLGLTLIGFLPDAILRPRLAEHSAGMPASLYFVGFLGGVFTVGPIGIIAGPLALSLLVQTVELFASGVDARDDLALESGNVNATSGGPPERAVSDAVDDPPSEDTSTSDRSLDDSSGNDRALDDPSLDGSSESDSAGD
jgi:predicted PurR-regulated permease PerM